MMSTSSSPRWTKGDAERGVVVREVAQRGYSRRMFDIAPVG